MINLVWMSIDRAVESLNVQARCVLPYDGVRSMWRYEWPDGVRWALHFYGMWADAADHGMTTVWIDPLIDMEWR